MVFIGGETVGKRGLSLPRGLRTSLAREHGIFFTIPQIGNNTGSVPRERGVETVGQRNFKGR